MKYIEAKDQPKASKYPLRRHVTIRTVVAAAVAGQPFTAKDLRPLLTEEQGRGLASALAFASALGLIERVDLAVIDNGSGGKRAKHLAIVWRGTIVERQGKE